MAEGMAGYDKKDLKWSVVWGGLFLLLFIGSIICGILKVDLSFLGREPNYYHGSVALGAAAFGFFFRVFRIIRLNKKARSGTTDIRANHQTEIVAREYTFVIMFCMSVLAWMLFIPCLLYYLGLGVELPGLPDRSLGVVLLGALIAAGFFGAAIRGIFTIRKPHRR